MIEIRSFIDAELREIQEFIPVDDFDGNNIAWPNVMPSMESLVPIKDFRFVALIDHPTPIGQSPNGIPLVAVIKIRIPIINVETVEEAFAAYDETLQSLNNEIQSLQQQQASKPELVVAQNVPGGMVVR